MTINYFIFYYSYYCIEDIEYPKRTLHFTGIRIGKKYLFHTQELTKNSKLLYNKNNKNNNKT